MKFSDRIGITTPPPLQINSISPELKTRLWNVILATVLVVDDKWTKRIEYLYSEFFPKKVDEVPVYWDSAKDSIKDWWFGDDRQWHELYNFIEFICETPELFPYDVSGSQHQVFEKENAGYRFISGVLTPITNEVEIEGIQEATSVGGKDILHGVQTHIKTAIELFSKKPTPEYRNSIKESISAVESLVKIISGNEKGGLKDAFKALESQVPIHGALKEGFLKLYGYTSDEDGIRHSIVDEKEVGFDEAKFMLVACSGFVNYLIAKADSSGKI